VIIFIVLAVVFFLDTIFQTMCVLHWRKEVARCDMLVDQAIKIHVTDSYRAPELYPEVARAFKDLRAARRFLMLERVGLGFAMLILAFSLFVIICGKEVPS
jgi:hypothetical protein